jgi:hypothetical protein
MNIAIDCSWTDNRLALQIFSPNSSIQLLSQYYQSTSFMGLCIVKYSSKLPVQVVQILHFYYYEHGDIVELSMHSACYNQ